MGYTWGDGSRWIMPGQYWKRVVQFQDFTAEFIFLDSNYEDTFGPTGAMNHNICGQKGNTDASWYCGAQSTGHALQKGGTTCDKTGPTDLDSCAGWFQKLND